MKPQRVILVDPMCVLDYGHNPQSLLYFKDFFEQQGCEVEVAVCRQFSLTSGGYGAFRRAFGYFYNDFIPLKSHVATKPAAGGGDGLEREARHDFDRLLDELDAGPTDLVLLPSADFYGTAGLMRSLMARPAKARPQAHVRFIGVMETATRYRHEPLRYLRFLTNQLKDTVRISAESPVYARFLQQYFERPCDFTLFPLKADPQPMPRDEPYVVYSAGSARADKGFFRILDIARYYAKTYPDDDVQFLIQNLPPQEEAANAAYVSQLYASPNIELIEATQSDDSMARHYARSSFLLMPYDYEIYKYRGSAVFMEGVTKARPFAITAGTGFHPLAEQLATSLNCATDEQFCRAIRAYRRKSADEVESEAALTAAQYESISNAKLSAVLN